MKKILALVLALVMTMSLATISSGAAYSDADEVRYTDAVNTLSALGVLGGYGDGSIRPAADVTRGAAAKMVAMVATGSNATAIGYYKGATTSFADVPATHTFSDAVSFCEARGIVEGYGNGYYGVGDNVKGWAVAKMVLVAMGYDAEAYGLTGTGAALRTITLATSLKLFAGMKADFDANAAASREECAQIVYNALTLEGKVATPTSNEGTVTFEGSKTSLMDNYFNVTEGSVALANLAKYVVVDNTATGEAYTKLAPIAGGDAIYVTNETGLDLFGHVVAIVDTGAEATKDGYSATTAFAVVDLSSVVEVSAAEEAAIDTKAEFVAKFGADSVSNASYFASYSDYVVDESDAEPIDGYTADEGSYVFYDNKLVSFLAPATFSVGYVSNYVAGTAAKNGTLTVAGDAADSWTLYTKTGETNYTMVSFYEGLAKGDIVIKTQTGALETLTKAATVTGKVSAVNNGTVKSITIGGKEYAQSSAFATTDAGDIYATAVLTWTGAMNKDVVAYVDASGAVFAMTEVAETATAAGLAYLVDTYKVSGSANAYGVAYDSYYVQAVNMEGKEVSYLVELSGEGTLAEQYAATGYVQGALVNVSTSYSTTLKTDVASFSAADDVYGNWIIDAGATAAIAKKVGDTNHYYASDVKTIYVAESLDELYVEVKAGVQDNDSAVYYAVKNGSNWDVKYIVVGGYSDTAVASTDIVYAAADAATDKSVTYTNILGQADSADVYNVYINGVLTEVKVDGDAPVEGFNKYSVDAVTGIYSFDTLESTDALKLETSAVVNRLYGTLLSFADVEDAEAKDAKVVDVRYASASAEEKAEMTEITTLSGLMPNAALDENTGATIAVVYNVSSTGKTVATIYVLAAPYQAATLTTDIGEKEFVAGGEYVEFTFSTVAGVDAGVMVYGGSDFGVEYEDSIVSLQYKAGESWIEMKGQNFGSAEGFALADATSTFRVKFAADADGDYSFVASMFAVEDDSVVCSVEVPFTVAAAAVEPV